MEPLIRIATPEDAGALVVLRAAMFAAMGQDVGGDDAPWREAARAWFADALRAGRGGMAVVAEVPGAGVVSSAMAQIVPRAPSPVQLDPRTAHIGQVSTLPHYRRNGLARACLSELLRLLEADGVRRFDLHATGDGDALYRSVGFADAPSPALRRSIG